MLSKRKLLSSTMLGGSAAVLAACSTTQIATFQSDWSAIVDEVQQAVAVVSHYIPTVESIAATAASLFGPEWAAAVAAGTAVVNQIEQALNAAVAGLTPPASTKLRARLAHSSVSTPIVIGVTPQGVQVSGYRV